MKHALHRAKIKILNELISNSELLILNIEENYRQGLILKRNEIFNRLQKIDAVLQEYDLPKINPLIEKKTLFLDELQTQLIGGFEAQQNEIRNQLSRLNSQSQLRKYLVRG